MNKHMRRLLLITFTLAAFIMPRVAAADHALCTNGNCLFNVIVEDNVPSGTVRLRVRHTEGSFFVKYKSKSLFPLIGRESYHDIAEHVTTATRLGKGGALTFIEKMKWDKYDPAPPQTETKSTTTVFAKQTPDPNTPIGKIMIDFEKPTMIEPEADVLADVQVSKQINMFLAQQQQLLARLNPLLDIGMIKASQAAEIKTTLLEAQLKGFTEKYDNETSAFKNALRFFDAQKESLKEKGIFNYE